MHDPGNFTDGRQRSGHTDATSRCGEKGEPARRRIDMPDREVTRGEMQMSRLKRGKGVGLGLFALVAAVAVTSLGAAGAGAKQTSTLASLPRDQTLYMSGNQWSPNTDLNPAKNWDYVTGLVGLVYETPFRYDPLKEKFIPWLATSGKWTTPSTYT